MAFDSPDLNLGSLLTEIGQGKIQLPDFQREWKWDDDRITSLLASVGRGYPVGVLMLLETGGNGASFAPKPISGATPPIGAGPEQLVLDGQQRLTSLFQSLTDGRPVDTTDVRGKRMKRWYYVSIAQALDGPEDLDDAVISVPEDKVIRDTFGKNVVADYSTPRGECSSEMFPLRIIFDMPAIFAWQRTYLETAPQNIGERNDRWNRFYTQVLANFIQYMVPAIVLKKDTPKEAVCTVFEKVNTGGVPLNVFELLTATFAADNYRLKDDWAARKARLDKRQVLRSLESTDFLQAVALLASTDRQRAFVASGASGIPPGVGCKRRDILTLRLDEYQKWAEAVTQALDWAANFLNQEHLYSANDLPYRTQLVPLAAIRVDLGGEADKIGVRNMLRQWYWSGVLGELYGGATESRFARDVEQMPSWVTGGPIPSSVADSSFREQRLLTLRTRNSAAYKGIYALLMRNGSPDWMKAEPMNMATFFSYQVDIHHIFPKSWCEKNGIDPARRESIVNKTAISRSTNISIGGRSPKDYVLTLQNKAAISAQELDVILESHEISPKALRSADFDEFFSDRTERLLKLISEAMGKEAIRETVEVGEATSGYEDEPEELSDEAEPEEAEITSPPLATVAVGSIEEPGRSDLPKPAWEKPRADSPSSVEVQTASAADAPGVVPTQILDFISSRASGAVADVAVAFARRLALHGGLELRPQKSRSKPWYFQVRTPRFRQVLAYVNVSASQVRVDYRLPNDYDTEGKAVARDNFYGISLKLQHESQLDLAMKLIEDALAMPK